MKHPAPVMVLLLSSLLVLVPGAPAQDQTYPAAEQQPQVQPAPQPAWTPEQLDNLVAPIALFPDPLLGQMLVASTYPLEVVEANQWLQRNRSLRGPELVDAAKREPWDPSVQALVAVPDALAKLNEDIRWTTDLGNAFLAQQADVMSAVQRMRARAQQNGRLTSMPQQTVSTQDQGGQQVIVIQPAEPEVIYVPVYDPLWVWGPPVYGYYPPLHYAGFGFHFGIGFNLGFCFGGWGGWVDWGWGPSWFGHSIFVNSYFFQRHGFHPRYWDGYRGRTAWFHDPVHRMRIPYRDSRVAARFAGDFRGSRNAFGTGRDMRASGSSYLSRSDGRSAGRGMAPGRRNDAPQAQRYQNPERSRYGPSRQYTDARGTQRFQSDSQGGRPSQQYRSPSTAYRPGTATQRYQNPDRSRYESSPSNRTVAAAQRSQGNSQRGQPSQQYRSPSMAYGSAAPTRRYQSSPQRYQPAQQYRTAPQQYRSAPQMSGQRSAGQSVFSRGGSSSRGNARVFAGAGNSPSRGGGGSFSRGSAGSISRGGGGSVSRGSAGSFSRAGGGSSRGGGNSGGGRRR